MVMEMSWLLGVLLFLLCGTGRDQYDSDSLAVNLPNS